MKSKALLKTIRTLQQDGFDGLRGFDGHNGPDLIGVLRVYIEIVGAMRGGLSMMSTTPAVVTHIKVEIEKDLLKAANKYGSHANKFITKNGYQAVEKILRGALPVEDSRRLAAVLYIAACRTSMHAGDRTALKVGSNRARHPNEMFEFSSYELPVVEDTSPIAKKLHKVRNKYTPAAVEDFPTDLSNAIMFMGMPATTVRGVGLVSGLVKPKAKETYAIAFAELPGPIRVVPGVMYNWRNRRRGDYAVVKRHAFYDGRGYSYLNNTPRTVYNWTPSSGTDFSSCIMEHLIYEVRPPQSVRDWGAYRRLSEICAYLVSKECNPFVGWPSNDAGVAYGLVRVAEFVPLLPRSSFITNGTGPEPVGVCMIYSAAAYAMGSKSKDIREVADKLWSLADAAAKEFMNRTTLQEMTPAEPAYFSSFRILRGSAVPQRWLWERGVATDLLELHSAAPTSQTSPYPILCAKKATDYSTPDGYPAGVGCEFTWRLKNISAFIGYAANFDNDPVKVVQESFKFMAERGWSSTNKTAPVYRRLWSETRVYADSGCLEFAAPPASSREELKMMYEECRSMAEAHGLEPDSETHATGGLHINVSVDRSDPLAAAVMARACSIVASMPYLAWCMNDASDQMTCTCDPVDDEAEAIVEGCGSKSSGAFVRGDRVEFRFVQMPWEWEEVDAAVDLCLAIMERARMEVVTGVPQPVQPVRRITLDFWNSSLTGHTSIVLGSMPENIEKLFDDAVRSFGLNPRRFSSFVQRNLPARRILANTKGALHTFV